MAAIQLGRDDLIAGLRELVVRLQRSGDTASIRIVGGAALRISVQPYYSQAIPSPSRSSFEL
jgi:hypothetical protein